jgi:hypothetical protein
VLEHREEIQADQMRDPLLVRARLLVSQLAAEHVRRRQRRREVLLDDRITSEDRFVAKQISGFLGSVHAIRHIAPRMLATDYLPSPVVCSLHFNAPGGIAFTQKIS